LLLIALGAIYYIPDLDGKVRVWINSTEGKPLACVEAELSNTKTVHQPGVAWTIAIIVGLGLTISAVVSGLGHSNTATHVASNVLSLFAYFQAQALIGMCSIRLPPIVRAWTQNFQWSMGIIRVGFLQKFAVWYQRATGGKPSKQLFNLANTSIQVQKRSLNSAMMQTESGQVHTVKGIERVGFQAKIERTNIFFTGYTILIIFTLFVTIGVILAKYLCELLIRAKKMKPEQFYDFRREWTLVLKGIVFRLIIIAFPQMVVLCSWEMTKRDSAGEAILAISTLILMITILSWASFKVWSIARRSAYKNPAYVLYSDPKILNKWGFLYVPYRADMYFFTVPILGYVLTKGLFVGLAQRFGVVQAIALLITETVCLITLVIIRPYIDRKTNAFNISIASVNLFNVILLLFFTGVFDLPVSPLI
jgi:Transient receptor potential (TRP) ion channel/ML-like domain